MDSDIEFKFNPIVVIPYSVCPLLFIYFMIDDVCNRATFEYIDIYFLVFACGLSWFFLPNVFKLLFGIPAIKLNPDKLINNITRINIDWVDVEEIRIKDSGRMSFLIIKLKNIGKYVNVNWLRILFNVICSLSDDEILINVSYVKGNNYEILNVIKDYKYRLKNQAI